MIKPSDLQQIEALTDDLPVSFDGLEKSWHMLTEEQKITALGRIWEQKKEIKMEDGKKYGYKMEEFIVIASSIIGVDINEIKVLFCKYLQIDPNTFEINTGNGKTHEDPPGQVPEKFKEHENKPDDNNKGALIKQAGATQPVVLTREAIHNINRSFAQRDKIKRLERMRGSIKK